MSDSPVKDIPPDSLDELLSRDPLSYTQNDITQIVLTLRKKREAWLVEESAPKKEPKNKKLTPQQLAELAKDLEL